MFAATYWSLLHVFTGPFTGHDYSYGDYMFNFTGEMQLRITVNYK